MNGTSDNFTKIYGRLLGVTKDIGDWGVEGGHIDIDRLRLTVEARRIEAKKLIESGLSQRQAAKALGIPKSTLNDTVSGNRTKDVRKPDAGSKHNNRLAAAAEVKNNLRGFLLMNAEAAVECAHYEGPVDDKIIGACRRVARAWNDLANDLEGGVKHE